ncbi:MAG: HPr family phosphocarrier protein [Geminicoccaceae bacterium]
MSGAAEDDAGGCGQGQALRRRVTVVNRRGLHARAAVKFVNMAEQFVADIEVARDNMVVCGTSIMGLMMLAAPAGSELEIRARGREAEAALDALAALVMSGFDES